MAVTGLLTADGGAVPRVVGVRTDSGDVRAELVVDAGGRRSAVGRWIVDAGGRAPVDERADCGFVYYGRHYRGAMPAGVDSMLTHNDSVSLLTLPADNGTWGVGITTSSRDRALRALRHVPCWEAAMRCYPATAGWIDAEPITGISVMAGIEDRQRQLVVDSVPVVTGLVAVGDAWASTNPSLGRGASIGALHACVLRDVVAKEGTADPDDAGAAVRRGDRRDGRAVRGLDPVLRPAPAGRDRGGRRRRAVPAGRPDLGDDPRAVGRRARRTRWWPGRWPRSRPCRRHPGSC